MILKREERDRKTERPGETEREEKLGSVLVASSKYNVSHKSAEGLRYFSPSADLQCGEYHQARGRG